MRPPIFEEDEIKELCRLLGLEGEGAIKVLNPKNNTFRTCGGLGIFDVGNRGTDFVNIDDLVQFLTDASEAALDDSKQDALRGVRMLLRGLRRPRRKEVK